MAITDEPNPERRKESQETGEDQAPEQESPQVFELAEDSADRDSDTSIFKKASGLPLDEGEEDHIAVVGGTLSDAASPEGEGDLELPEDELVDLPVSQNFRLISTTDRPEDAGVPSSAPTSSAGETAEGTAPEWETEHVVPGDAQEFLEQETRGDAALSEPQPVLEKEVGDLSGVSSHTEAQSLPSADDAKTAVEAALADSRSPVAEPPESELAEGVRGEEEVLLVRLPEDDRWIPLSELVVKTTGEPIGLAAARWITRLYLKSLEGDGSVAAVGEYLPEGGPQEGEAGHETLVFPQLETAAGEADYRERVRKARPSKSLFGELVGIVLGGVCGLLIAYYALNYFGGKRYDFANIPLPGIPHTYHHLPSWAKGWFREASPGQNTINPGGESSDERM